MQCVAALDTDINFLCAHILSSHDMDFQSSRTANRMGNVSKELLVF